jgi:hypothetical protein
MEKTKHSKMWLTAIPVILVLAVCCFLARNTETGHFVLAHLNFGPHMSCELKLTVDDRVTLLNEDQITGLTMSNGKVNTVSQFGYLPGQTGMQFKCEGKEYGSQPFQITVQGTSEALQIPVSVIVPDDWEVTEITLDITVDTVGRSYTYTAEGTMGNDHTSSAGTLSFDGDSVIRLSFI